MELIRVMSLKCDELVFIVIAAFAAFCELLCVMLWFFDGWALFLNPNADNKDHILNGGVGGFCLAQCISMIL